MYRGERMNSITHLIGTSLALAGLVVLVVLAGRQGDPWKIVSFSVYGVTLTALYFFSTLYHSVRGASKKVIWGLALFGIVQDALITRGRRILSVVIYLLMGWLALIAIRPLANALPGAGMAWMLAGGIFYTIGVVFYALDKKISYGHEIFHLFVMAGSACHYLTILVYVA
jgi:hemolysin III